MGTCGNKIPIIARIYQLVAGRQTTIALPKVSKDAVAEMTDFAKKKIFRKYEYLYIFHLFQSYPKLFQPLNFGFTTVFFS